MSEIHTNESSLNANYHENNKYNHDNIYYHDCIYVNKIVLMLVNPHCLFAYWNINYAEKKNINDNNHRYQYIALKVSNITLNKCFLIRVNSFSDSWYISVDNSNCLYNAEIGIKMSDGTFTPLCKSNTVSTPLNYISDDTTQVYAHYKNVKQRIEKPRAIALSRDVYPYISGSKILEQDSSINIQEAVTNKLLGINSEGILQRSGSRRRI